MRRKDLGIAVVAGVAFAAAISIQIVRDRWYPRDDPAREQILYVTSGKALQRIALSFDAVLADVYWIRAIQHYGGDRLSGPTAQTNASSMSPSAISWWRP